MKLNIVVIFICDLKEGWFVIVVFFGDDLIAVLFNVYVIYFGNG